MNPAERDETQPQQEGAAKAGARLRFRPHEHVRKREVFSAAFAQRRAVSDAVLVVHAIANELPHARIGVSIPRRLTRKAVVRNHLKRLIREAFRLRKSEMPPGYDLIVVPRQTGLTAAAVLASLAHLARDAARRAAGSRTLSTPPPTTNEPPP